MKKIITILIILCITFCACSKSAETPVSSESGTNIPSDTKDGNLTPTATVTVEPTEKPIKTIIADCPICGRKETECKEFVKKQYDTTLRTDIDKAYYLCDTCYEKVLENEHDCEIYDKIYKQLIVLITDDKLKEEIISVTLYSEYYLRIDTEGVEFTEVCPLTTKAIKENIPGIEKMTTSEPLWFAIYCNEEQDMLMIKPDRPVNILNTLKDK